MAEDNKNKTSQEKASETKKKVLDNAKTKDDRADVERNLTKFMKSFESTFEKSFNSMLKGISGVEKSIKVSNDKLERIADNSTKIAFNTSATMERLYTLLKHEREDDKNKSVLIDGKQFSKIERIEDNTSDISRRTLMVAERLWTLIKHESEDDKDKTVTINDKQFSRIEMMNKNVSSINSRTLMVAERLWTLIKHERKDDSDNSIIIDEKQFSRIEMMNKNISSINKRADNIQQRIWVLQDLMYKVMEYPKFDTLLDTMVQRHLIDIEDILKSFNSGGKKQSNAANPLKFELMIIGDLLKDILYIQQKALNRLVLIHKLTSNSIGSLMSSIKTSISLQQKPQNPKTQPPSQQWWELWSKDFKKEFGKFADNFTGIFQRGIIGRLAGLNPLVSVGIDLLRDVFQTLSDIGGTFFRLFTTIYTFFTAKKSAKSGSGASKLQKNQNQQQGVGALGVLGGLLLSVFSGAFKGIESFADSSIKISKNIVSVTESIGNFLKSFTGKLGFVGKAVETTTSVLWKGSKMIGSVVASIAEKIGNASRFIGGFLSGRGFFSKVFGLLGKFAAPLYATVSGIFGAFEDVAKLTYDTSWVDQAILTVTRGMFEFIGIFVDTFVDLPTLIFGKLFGIDWLAEMDFSKLFVEFAQKGIISLMNFINSDILGDLTLNMKKLWNDSISFITDWWNTTEMNPENWEWIDKVTELFSSIPEMIKNFVNHIVDMMPEWLVPDSLKEFGMGKIDTQQGGVPSTVVSEPIQQSIPDKVMPAPALNPERLKENQQKFEDEKASRGSGGNTTVVNNVAAGMGQQYQMPPNIPIYPHNTESTFFGMG